MEYDYSALRGRIVEIFGTQARFAAAMGRSERTISLKLDNKVEWKQDEMILASKILKFENGVASIPKYFFARKVQS